MVDFNYQPTGDRRESLAAINSIGAGIFDSSFFPKGLGFVRWVSPSFHLFLRAGRWFLFILINSSVFLIGNLRAHPPPIPKPTPTPGNSRPFLKGFWSQPLSLNAGGNHACYLLFDGEKRAKPSLLQQIIKWDLFGEGSKLMQMLLLNFEGFPW